MQNADPRKKPMPAGPQQDMTQDTFDHMSPVVSASDYTGLLPAELNREEVRALEEEFDGAHPPE